MTDTTRARGEQEAARLDTLIQRGLSAVRGDSSAPVGSYYAVLLSALRAAEAEGLRHAAKEWPGGQSGVSRWLEHRAEQIEKTNT